MENRKNQRTWKFGASDSQASDEWPFGLLASNAVGLNRRPLYRTNSLHQGGVLFTPYDVVAVCKRCTT